MAGKQKILICGDAEGKFNALFNRVDSINKKSGPFDLLLCVGNFFGINNKEFEPYRLGEKKVSIPTYILGPNKEDHLNLYETDYELCHNVYYLGKRGLFTSSGGLKIAYISGISNTENDTECYYSSKDVKELFEVCLRGNPSYRGVDILLTSQWPTGVEKGKESSLAAPSDLVSWLIMKIKPRYHFCGLEGVYYEKPPFRIPSDQEGSLEIVTRFISLARVANNKKDKWLFALSLTPLEKMKLSELLQKTTDETVCPFDLADLDSKIFKTKKKAVSSSQYFYDMDSQDEKGIMKKGNKRQKMTFDQSKCWFCLASPSVEKHLIITVGNCAYLALAKGGLVEEHFLICPVEHFQCAIGQPAEVIEEIDQFKEAIRKFYERNNRVPVFFERNYKTSHMQLQSVPISEQAQKELKEIFMDEAEGNGFKLEELDSNSRLDQVVPSGVPYFSVELPNGMVLYAKIQRNVQFPLNFGREVLASGPILNMAERIDWKECILQKEDEESLVQRMRSDFEPFDFTL